MQSVRLYSVVSINIPSKGLDREMRMVIKRNYPLSINQPGTSRYATSVPTDERRKQVTTLAKLCETHGMTSCFSQRSRRFRYRHQYLILDRARRSWRTRRVNQKTGFSSSISTAA